MKEIIEKKLGCSIEECYKRMVDFCKGGSSTPCYLANLTDEEFNYMMEEINIRDFFSYLRRYILAFVFLSHHERLL